MRRIAYLVVTACTLALGACSSGEDLTGVDRAGASLPALQDGGTDPSSNNGKCCP